MTEKLRDIEKRYIAIEEKLSDPEIVSDLNEYKKVSREYKSLTPVVEKYREYRTYEKDLADAEEILGVSDDPEMRTLAEEQAESARKSLAACADELKLLLLPRDPNDDKNVIIEIRGGAGLSLIHI